MDEVSDCSGETVSGGIIGESAFDGEEFHSTVFSGATGVINPESIVPILVHARTNIPPLFSMISKGGGTRFGSNIDNSSCAKRSKGGAVEVKFSKNLVISRQFWIDPGCPEEVQGDDGLWEELIPQACREALVSPIEDGGEVVFKGADGPFSWIGAVVVCSNELVFELLLLDLV